MFSGISISSAIVRRAVFACGVLFCTAAVGLSSGESYAQNARAEPIYGYVNRVSPFKPDPTIVRVSAGGHANTRDLDMPAACRGFIHPEAPALTLRYTASSVALQIYVHAGEDTTLIVRDPAGKWVCDDDSLAKNPAIRFAQPVSGSYAIWVGSYGGGAPAADVYISER